MIRVRALVVALVIGTAAAVFLSWASLMLFGIPEVGDKLYSDKTALIGPYEIGERFGVSRVLAIGLFAPYDARARQERSVPKFVAMPVISTPDQSPPIFFESVAAGWPLRCMRMQYESLGTGGSNGHFVGTFRRPGLRVEATSGHLENCLPIHPLWSGMIVDTGVFGGLLSFVVMMSSLCIRKWRRSKGCCIYCGYKCGGIASGNCPECGKTMVPD